MLILSKKRNFQSEVRYEGFYKGELKKIDTGLSGEKKDETFDPYFQKIKDQIKYLDFEYIYESSNSSMEALGASTEIQLELLDILSKTPNLETVQLKVRYKIKNDYAKTRKLNKALKKLLEELNIPVEEKFNVEIQIR